MKFYNINAIVLTTIFLLMGCKENTNTIETSQNPTTILEDKSMNLAHLLGTWHNADNPEQQFSLYNDGTLSQHNLQNLEAKDWTLKENKIVFARKNSNSEQTQINSVIYHIKELTADKLILEQDGTTFTYNKKQ